MQDEQTASLLRQAIGSLSRRLRATGKTRGRMGDAVGLTALSVLSRLHHMGPRTPSALAADEDMQPQSLTRVLAALEDKGLIDRSGDPQDRRQVLIRLTEDGLSLLREEARHREAWLRRALAPLSPTEREVLRLAAGLMLDMVERCDGPDDRDAV
ncbi:MarR family winged helix-turn-helix transcriptional regulator [Azospirillum endophyticum]